MTDGTVLFTRTWFHDDPVATVLLVHGVSEHMGRWDHVAEYLVGEGFEVFGFDQRAHGESGDGILDIEDFTLFVDDVADMIAARRTAGRPLILYGHSMGGLISVLHAQSAHPQPDLMVLSAPALVAAVPAPLRLAARVLGRFAPKLAMASAVEKAHLSRDPDVGEAYVNDPLVYLKGTTRFGRLLFAAMDRARAAIGRISTPTLVVHGSEDELVPPRASASLASVESVERRVFPGLRHEMHNEPESDQVLGFITRWVKEHLK
jgi:alpha-beta hydrolase superfamily lysophospholipase